MILFFPYTLSLKDLIQVHDLNPIYMLTALKFIFSPISVQNSKTLYPTIYFRFILGCQIDYLKFSTFKHELPLPVPSKMHLPTAFSNSAQLTMPITFSLFNLKHLQEFQPTYNPSENSAFNVYPGYVHFLPPPWPCL